MAGKERAFFSSIMGLINKMNEYLKRLLVFHLLYIIISIGLCALSINWAFADVCIYVLFIASSIAWVLYAVFLISVLCNYGMAGTDYLYPDSLILSLKRILLLDVIRILYCKELVNQARFWLFLASSSPLPTLESQTS